MHGSTPALDINLAANRVGRQRLLEHRRQPGGRRHFRGVAGALERGRQILHPLDQAFQLLAVGVGIHFSAGECLGPPGHDPVESVGKAAIECQGLFTLDTAPRHLLLPAASQAANRGSQTGRRLSLGRGRLLIGRLRADAVS